MIKINFEHLDESIELTKGSVTIMVVESNAILGKIAYSLCDRSSGYFKIFDENYKPLLEKRILTIFNPLQFDFDDKSVKNLIYTYIIEQINMDIDFKQNLENQYQHMVSDLSEYLMNNIDIDLLCNNTVDIKDILKLAGISVNIENVTCVFDKIQLLLEVLKEIMENKLLIFINLNTMLTKEEYKLIVEQIDLNKQTVLLIEGNLEHLEEYSYFCLDNDFYLYQNML